MIIEPTMELTHHLLATLSCVPVCMSMLHTTTVTKLVAVQGIGTETLDFSIYQLNNKSRMSLLETI
jgi:hypothetical protein